MHNSQTITRTIVAKSSGVSTQGTLVVVEFGEKDRLKRTVRAALTSLGITALCILIPGAHFILVPLGLLVVTPLISYLTWRVHTKILSANVVCPQCSNALTVLTSQEKYPLYENCASCHRQIAISKSS